MNKVRYTDDFPPAAFLDLVQRVWPGDYGLAEVTKALGSTINFGAWDGELLVGSVRVLSDGYFSLGLSPRFWWTRATGGVG